MADKDGGGGGNVKVVCRLRPQQERELLGGGEVVAHVSKGKSVSIDVGCALYFDSNRSSEC